jgi:hypothetical protein
MVMVFKNVAEAVEAYVAMRNELRAWKKEVDQEEADRKKILEDIEMWLLSKADEMGVDSFKTPMGTAYKQIQEHYRIGDWVSFVDFVKRTNNFQLFEKRVAKLAAKEIHQTNGEVPDGLDYSSEYVIHVLRPSKKKGEEEE